MSESGHRHRHRSSSQASNSSRRRDSEEDGGSEYRKSKRERERKEKEGSRDPSRERRHQERREGGYEETKEERRARRDREKADKRAREEGTSSRGAGDTSSSRGIADPTAAYGGSPYTQDPNYQAYPPPVRPGSEYPVHHDQYGGDREYPAHSVTGQYSGGQYPTYPQDPTQSAQSLYGQSASFDPTLSSGYPTHDSTSPAQGYSGYPQPPTSTEPYGHSTYAPGSNERGYPPASDAYGSSNFQSPPPVDPYATGYSAPPSADPYGTSGFSEPRSTEPYAAAQYPPSAHEAAQYPPAMSHDAAQYPPPAAHEAAQYPLPVTHDAALHDPYRPPSVEQHAPGGFPESPKAETYPAHDQYAPRPASGTHDRGFPAPQDSAYPATSEQYAPRPASGTHDRGFPTTQDSTYSTNDQYAPRPASGTHDRGFPAPPDSADPYSSTQYAPPPAAVDPYATTGNYPPAPPSTDPYASSQYQSGHGNDSHGAVIAGAAYAAGAAAAGQSASLLGTGDIQYDGGYPGQPQETYGAPQQPAYGVPSEHRYQDHPPLHHSSSEIYASAQAGESQANISYGAPDFQQLPPAAYNPDTAPHYHPKPEPTGPPPKASVPYTAAEKHYASPLSASISEPTKKKSAFSNFGKMLHTAVHDLARDFTNSSAIQNHHSTHTGSTCSHPDHFQSDNRFGSFAEVRRGNMAKWFVDGKDYCYAVSCAIEKARESIWILDWWLSPELYLRRPPAYNQPYRLDRMLQAAAQRGVKVNIIVYKEVTQALTLSSAHTKHALEALHENIAVFRHPDHLPDRQTLAASMADAVKTGNFSLQQALSGFTTLDDSVVLYWAHHEKLCLIDGTIEGGGIAFMGGLDLCWGRWDLSHHPISDTHPTDPNETLFLGQDYNNARVMDFHTVEQYDQNKLNRTESSRMGWSDVALCLTGPTVEDLKEHFVDRWNFIYDEKARGPDNHLVYDFNSFLLTVFDLHQYAVRKDVRFNRLFLKGVGGDTHGFEGGTFTGVYGLKGKVQQFAGRMRRPETPEEKRRRQNDQSNALAFGDSSPSSSSSEEEEDPRRHEHRRIVADKAKQFMGYGPHDQEGDQPLGVQCQVVRSCCPWSNGTKTEHSIQNAYIEVISAAKHFIYIENQFFITVTGPQNGPVKNKIGEAIVNRIIQAYDKKEKFRVIVCIPSVPAFAGDLKDAGSLGTRAIMEFQYDGICRASKVKGTSILERIQARGINPYNYIRFFNLRNYDRINISSELEKGEQQSGVKYDTVQQDLENKYGANWQTAPSAGGEANKWQQGSQMKSTTVADSVAQCAMLGGGDIRDARWSGDPAKEIDAFVSEELYIHSKLLIADDRIVICGSANFNDRSQLGDHDSEIAIILEDNTPLASRMDHQPYTASHYAGTLRRYLFRKHLGLLPAQSMQVVDDNMMPVPAPNIYDFDSPEDEAVMDPLDDRFWELWSNTAKTNTDAFAKVFHPVPYDGVRNWKEYDKYFGQYFHPPKESTKERPLPAKYPWGHVVKDEFAPGVEGVKQVKDVLSRIRGHLVEMPMNFLKDLDIAKESAELNAFTEEIYT